MRTSCAERHRSVIAHLLLSFRYASGHAAVSAVELTGALQNSTSRKVFGENNAIQGKNSHCDRRWTQHRQIRDEPLSPAAIPRTREAHRRTTRARANPSRFVLAA